MSFCVPAVKRHWLAAAIVLAVFFGGLPVFFGLFFAGLNDLIWKGTPGFSYGDFPVYLSYLAQAKDHWLFANYFTTEPLHPWFSFFWLVLGKIGALFHLSPAAAFHAARLTLILVLIFVTYSFIKKLLKPEWRLLALFVFLFSSGFGFFFAVFFNTSDYFKTPIDLWVAEGNVFSSMLFSPHFVAAWIFILLVMMLLMEALVLDSRRRAVWAGCLGFILFLFHPYHAITIYAVLLVWTVFQLLARRLNWRQIQISVIFLAISVPSVAYQYFVTHRDEFARAVADNNFCLTPDFWFVLLGFGVISVLWPIGWRLARREGNAARWDFLFVWAAVQFVVIYLPFSFQRHLLQGLEFPLVILSMPVLFKLLSRRHNLESGLLNLSRSVLLVLLIVSFVSGSLVTLLRPIKVFSGEKSYFFFLSKAQAGALDWVKINTPEEAVFLANAPDSLNLVGWGDRRVYSGHWAETINGYEKESRVSEFFSSSSAAERLAFICQNKIDYVWCSSADKICPDQAGFTLVYEADGIIIYQVADCPGFLVE